MSSPARKKKMRDVSDAKKQVFFEVSNRVINFQTVCKSDLMLCVKED